MIQVATGFAVVGLAVFVGYIVGRTGVLGPHARFVFSRLVFYVLSPFLLFVVLARADLATLFSALLPVSMLTAIVILAIFLGLSRWVLRRGWGESVIGSLSAAQVNSNNMGIPLSLYMLGSAAFPAPVILFQLLILMPVALAVLDAAQHGTASIGRIVKQTLQNPMLIGSALGVVVAILGIDLPPVALEPLTFIADACVPVMLISYGMSLFGQRVLAAPGRRIDILVATALKLVAMPLVAWAIGMAFGLPADQLVVVVFLAALPTAQNVFNFAQRYDTGESVARDTILLTTIGCVPVLLAVVLLLG